MLTILEYSDVGSTQRGSLPIPLEPPIGQQAIDIGPNSVQSNPFKDTACIVKLSSDEDCLIAIGPDPDATGASRKLKAGIEQTVSVPIGMNFKVAAIATSGSVSGMDSLESLLKLMASPSEAQKQFAVMQDQVAKFSAAAQELKVAGDEHRAMQANLAQATQEALDARAAADKATAELAQREAAFDKDAQDHADKVKADQVTADDRVKALGGREADLATTSTALNKRGAELADLASNLDKREEEVAARESAVAASESDYEARIAKLKALTA